MTRFHLLDIVALKSDGSFYGAVRRLSGYDQDVLDDTLIIAYTHVPPELLKQFVLTGIPPTGYVFVQFSRYEQGSALVAEDDLYLIDRSLELGETVKRDGSTLTGTVVNISKTFVLDPVWHPQLTGDFRAKPTDECSYPDHTCTSVCNPLDPRIAHPQPCRLIHNVPDEELKRTTDIMQYDRIFSQDWLGLVDEYDTVVVIKLENNSVVVIDDTEGLFVPVPDYDKPLVHLPEFDDIPRPHVVLAIPGWSQVISVECLEPGQLVVFDPNKIKKGRWLRGTYQPDLKNHGRVLMVRANHLSVRWLMCNPYTPAHHWEVERPDRCNPYENLSTFPNPQEIRRDKRVVLYNPNIQTTTIEDRTRSSHSREEPEISRTIASVKVSNDLRVYPQVRFRDSAGAAVKYQGREYDDVVHHRFERVHHTETLGYDVNEFRIVHSKQRATVQWQDGSMSEHDSILLTRANLFENVLSPSNLVVAREGMKQKVAYDSALGGDQPDHSLIDFNEMTFFERPHDLFPAKVGVIQNVDPDERIAHVRWFQSPKIRITTSGNALGADSRFGPISDEIEAVSLYEVMTFPGITREIGDLAVFAPSSPSSRSIKILSQITEDDLKEVNASVTLRSQMPDRDQVAILEWLQYNAYKSMDEIPTRQTPSEQYKPHRSVDWAGEIVKLGIDGLVHVRVNVGDQTRDVVLEHDQILAVVDDEPWSIDLNADVMQVDGLSDGERSEASYTSDDEVLAETVEYEGGERIDDDSDDENWESDSGANDDEETEVSNRHTTTEMALDVAEETLLQDHRKELMDQLTEMFSVPPPSLWRKPPTSSSLPAVAQGSQLNSRTLIPANERSLRSFLPSSAPPTFLSLESDPPKDQFRVDQSAATSSSFSKRIIREHRILNSSLPEREIYVRTYDSRLDLLRCLIVGPRDTPYEYAPFLIDLHLGPDFPHKPPTAHFHSWTSGLGRINPNLYEDGKICLSLLGTWPGKSDTESWSEKATILQLLISLQGLVFVKAPFFNEAGYEGEERSGQYRRESLVYTEKAFVMARNFVKHALSRPIPGFEDVLAWLYLAHDSHDPSALTASLPPYAMTQRDNLSLLFQVVERGEIFIEMTEALREYYSQPREDSEGYENSEILVAGDGSCRDPTSVFLLPLSKGALVMLRKTMEGLREIEMRESVGGGPRITKIGDVYLRDM